MIELHSRHDNAGAVDDEKIMEAIINPALKRLRANTDAPGRANPASISAGHSHQTGSAIKTVGMQKKGRASGSATGLSGISSIS
jgi:hypothetical protein